MSQKILVTGASSGFGTMIVHTLMEGGHKVAASMRGVEGKNAKAAEELRAKGAVVVELDVTSDESTNQGVAKAIEGLGGLDGVVNNAGVGVIGLQENFTIEDWKTVFEVNVFGVQRVMRAALPTLRAQGSGLLISISSLLGRMTIPFYGPYNATKWALEAMMENYRSELSNLGIESCLVEPGGFATDFFDKLIQPSDTSRDESYGELVGGPKALFEAFEGALAENSEQNPQLVADAVRSLVDADHGTRPFRTPVDKLGMGDALIPTNELLEGVTRGVYGNFGLEGMLEVKTS